MPSLSKHSRNLNFLYKCERMLPETGAEGHRFSLIRTAHEIWGPNFRVRNTRFNGYSLLYCQAGTGTITTDAFESALTPQSLFLHGPLAAREISCGPDEQLSLFIIQFEIVREDPHSAGESALTPSTLWLRPLLYPDAVEPLFATLHNLAGVDSAAAAKLGPCYVAAILQHANLAEKSGSKAAPPPPPWAQRWVQRALRHVTSAARLPHSVQAWAQALGVSPSFLHRTFKLCRRRPPNAVLLRLKMQRACQLLSEYEPVDAVADALGYSDRFAFSKAFKRHNGTTPAAWLNQGSAQEQPPH